MTPGMVPCNGGACLTLIAMLDVFENLAAMQGELHGHSSLFRVPMIGIKG